ncbi:MAG: tetratricopeptide repeat protein [Deltaproteobacteria bacterium]|nr:tetratricopeptide repeat protein [Deltaproteobacteria bacterium]
MKVNCPKCSRAYKVDDHRIPDGGLKMRCPQCSQSFRVSKSAETSTDTPETKEKEARHSIRPKRPVRPSRTSLRPPKPPAPKGSSAGDSASAASSDDMSFDFPDDPQDVGDFPSLPPISDEGSDGLQKQPDKVEEFDELEIPSSQESVRLSEQVEEDPFGDIDLPAPASSPGATGTKAGISLRLAPTDSSAAPDDVFGEIDLPAPAGGVDFSSSADGIDLPSPAGIADLPSPAGVVDLPSPAGIADLPSPAGVVDLPSPAGIADLPSPAGIADLPSPVGAVDLPSPAGDNDVIGGTLQFGSAVGTADLPSPASAIDLPSPAGVSAGDDPFGGTIDLPSPADASVGDDPFGSIDLSPQSEDIVKSPLDDDSTADMDLAPPGETDFSDISLPDLDGISESASGSQSPDSSTQELPPLGSTLGFDAPDPGPPDRISLQKVSMPPAVGDTKAGITKSHRTSGTTNFGEVDLGPVPTEGSSSSLPVLDETSTEFDAFPTSRETDEGEISSGDKKIELDTDPLDFKMPGTVIDGPVGDAAEGEGRRPATSFSGRRRFERQSRRSKILLLGLLVILIVAGAGMGFTPLGPFGAFALYKLLPSAASDEMINLTEKSVTRLLTADTAHSIKNAANEIDLALKQLPDNEDLRLLSVFVHNWHQIRFGVDKRHSAIATQRLGSINLNESESRFAPLAKATQLIRTGRLKEVVAALGEVARNTANGLSLSATGYLLNGNNSKALETGKKLEAKEKSARASFLVARALINKGDREQAKKKLEAIVGKYPKHVDSVLSLVEVFLELRPIPRQKVIETVNKIIGSKENFSTKSQKAKAHALLGYFHFIERKYKEASAEFDVAHKLDPSSILAEIGKGEIALQNKDYSAAAMAFNKVKAEEPGNLFAILGSIETALSEGKLSETKDALIKVMPKNPRNARVHYLMGRVQWSLKQLEEAEKEFKTAIELDKEFLNAYIALSQMLLKIGRNNDAMVVLDDASEAVPGSSLINQTLADAQALRGDFAAAIAELDKALVIEPDNVRSHFRMGQMYRKMDAVEDATRSFAEVEKRSPNYPGLSLEQGLLMELAGNVEEALAAYKKALSKSPDDIKLKLRVAAASFLLEDYKTSEKHLTEAIATEAKSPEINFYLGETFRMTGRWAEALVLLKVAVENEPENARYHLRYGMVLFATRTVDQAMREYKTAIQLNPKLAEAFVRVGEIQLAQGSARDAIQSIDKGLGIDPSIADGYELIAEAFEQLSDLRSAVGYYRRAVKAIPDNAEIYFKLGLAELGVFGNRVALSTLLQAVKLTEKLEPHPSWLPEALYRLGAAQHAQGQRAGACSSFGRYITIAPEDHIDRTEVLAHMDRLSC